MIFIPWFCMFKISDIHKILITQIEPCDPTDIVLKWFHCIRLSILSLVTPQWSACVEHQKLFLCNTDILWYNVFWEKKNNGLQKPFSLIKLKHCYTIITDITYTAMVLCCVRQVQYNQQTHFTYKIPRNYISIFILQQLILIWKVH